MENSKFCPHCGNQLAENVKFCPKCGYQLTDTTDAQSTTAPKAQASASATTQTTATSSRSTNDSGSGSFNDRIDSMMKWLTNNWATALIIVIGILAFSLIMRMLFYHASLGLIALVAVLVWLYTFAWSNGTAPTSMEKQLRPSTQGTKTGAPTATKPVEKSAPANANQNVQPTTAASANAANPATAGQTTSTTAGGNTIYVQTGTPQQTNGMGTAGFVLALISFLFSWIPGVSYLVWFLGALFSFIGLFKQPKGLAIAGFILSFFDLIVVIFVSSALIGILSSL